MSETTHVLVVAKPGRLRDSLQVFLASLPGIAAVRAMEDASDALRCITDRAPDMVILDMSVSDDGGRALLHEIKRAWPMTRAIAVAEDLEQQSRAVGAGADAALLRGFPTRQLSETIDALVATNQRQAANR